jgi:hypothetical protein
MADLSYVWPSSADTGSSIILSVMGQIISSSSSSPCRPAILSWTEKRLDPLWWRLYLMCSFLCTFLGQRILMAIGSEPRRRNRLGSDDLQAQWDGRKSGKLIG